VDPGIRGLLRRGSPAILIAIAAALIGVAASSPKAVSDVSNQPVAIVGNHMITQAELDARTKLAIERLRQRMQHQPPQILTEQTAALKRHALRRMTEDYLLEDAAKRENLNVAELLKKSEADSRFTDAQAKQYYDRYGLHRLGSFERVKPRIFKMLARKALIRRLRQDEPVRILLEPKPEKGDSGEPSLSRAS
jgi:hypothetical protein